MHHLCLRVFLEGKPVKYPHLRQQALNKCQVAFLVLVYLLTLRVALSEVELVFPAVQTVLLQHLIHHLRHRFIDEETVAAELFIQQGKEGFEG
ncbi:hypothetical protein ENINMM144B1_23740 [Enterobacter intestinihominis]|nr:Uncharacterised protein [Enterobacter hormaechei]SAP93044.1 Uncharacterised protein [Enterobacter hormaechei]